MLDSIEAARQRYAEQLRSLANISSPALFAAFSTVPRERFVGPGPWRVKQMERSWKTEDADPRRVYQNLLIALDEARGINTGQPSMWAHFLDQLGIRANDHVLHLGCGTGYYTAILAELAGPQGKVTAIEIEASLAEEARIALAPWPNAVVIHGDGSRGPFEPADGIVASAGATHPQPSWLAALKPNGKLLFPLTPSEGPGAMAFLTRKNEISLDARLDFGVYFIGFSGARDAKISEQLSAALNRDHGKGVQSLRCDAHDRNETCWLHGEGWCFSTRSSI